MLPYLTETRTPSKKYMVAFKGLNYGENTIDGELAESYNLSTDQYPCITQRAARVVAGQYNNPTTLHAKGKLLVIDGTKVLYGDTKVGEVTEGKKQTATVGNYIVIFPDKKYYRVPTDDEPEGKFGNMEETYTASGLKFTTSTISKINFPFDAGDAVMITGCSVEENNMESTAVIETITADELTLANASFTEATEDGEVTITRPDVVWTGNVSIVSYSKLSGASDGAELPFKAGDTVIINGKNNTNKELVIKAKEGSHTLVFDGDVLNSTNGWTDYTITRKGTEQKVKGLTFKDSTISKTGGEFPFKDGDAVTITGCSEGGNNKEAEIIIRGVSADELTFDDNAFTEATEWGAITIARTVPDLDFICESNYRLWGTHKNTIYSSKFSDPLNFKVFDGLSNDSYAIDVGSEGDFTGCIPYSSHICFFKENTLHKMYGTKPSNFQITTVNVYGVQSGSEKSMHIVNEQLLYKGVGGVYSYTGGVPELISENFGNKRYSDAVACCDGETYYISMKQGDTYNIFAYDVAKNIWLREDDTQAVDMAFYNGKVYFLDAKGGLHYIDKTADRNNIEWGATFCTMHETINERKGYSKFHLRMDLSAGAWLAVDIKTDNDLQWRQIYTTHNEKAKTVSIPIMPTRCDSIDIRLRGKGKCTIKTFIREFTVGSDV